MPSVRSTDFLQGFVCVDGKPLGTLPTHICADTGQRFVLWSDIGKSFWGADADYLEDRNKDIVLFLIRSDGEL